MSDATSLDRLHDIVEPPPVPWWPPAVGWYVVLAVAASLILLALVRMWARYRANAYRRAALRELASADTTADVSLVLRRTALVFAPRATLATLDDAQWPGWLAARASQPMPDAVAQSLRQDIYGASEADAASAAIKAYATYWIRHHRVEQA